MEEGAAPVRCNRLRSAAALLGGMHHRPVALGPSFYHHVAADQALLLPCPPTLSIAALLAGTA